MLSQSHPSVVPDIPHVLWGGVESDSSSDSEKDSDEVSMSPAQRDMKKLQKWDIDPASIVFVEPPPAATGAEAQAPDWYDRLLASDDEDADDVESVATRSCKWRPFKSRRKRYNRILQRLFAKIDKRMEVMIALNSEHIPSFISQDCKAMAKLEDQLTERANHVQRLARDQARKVATAASRHCYTAEEQLDAATPRAFPQTQGYNPQPTWEVGLSHQ